MLYYPCSRDTLSLVFSDRQIAQMPHLGFQILNITSGQKWSSPVHAVKPTCVLLSVPKCDSVGLQSLVGP